MKVLVQWATASPDGWEEIDSSEWGELPDKGVPSSGELIDSARGWVTAVCVQGVIFQGKDHVALEDLPGGALRVTYWTDDPEDHVEPHGEAWTFHPPAPDPAFGGRLNTRQELELYTPDGTLPRPVETTGGRARVRRFRDFRPPHARQVRHGVWLPDQLYEAHSQLWGRPDWREWA